MVAKGQVRNGVVVLGDAVRFDEGQEVTVFAAPAARAAGHGVADIRPVSLDTALPPEPDDDPLGEMLEGCR